MNLLPDTAALRTSAVRIGAEADELSARCRTLRAGAAQTKWTSTAASRYRGEAEGICVDIDAVVNGLHHAAATMRAHAESVDHIVQAALRLPASVMHEGEQLAGDGVRAVTRLIGVG